MAKGRLSATLFGASALACSNPYPHTNHDDEVGFEDPGPPYGPEASIGPNPFTLTALEYEQPYTRIAAGNVARGVVEPGCCFDYVLAGPAADDVRVVFGGGSDEGLAFLSDRPDEVLALGPIDDVLLLDLDEDGRNDLVGLRPKAGLEVVVRLGIPAPGPDGPFLASEGVGTSTVAPGGGQVDVVAKGYRDFAAGDLDCDGHVDLVIAAPESRQVVTLLGRGDGSFESPTGNFVGVPPGRGSVRVAVAQLDGQGGDDVISANNDGSMSVLLADDCQGTVTFKNHYVLRPVSPQPCQTSLGCWDNTENAVVAAGNFCPSSPDIDAAYAFEEQIWIICGSAGNFNLTGEQPHGQGVPVDKQPSVADYHFDLDGKTRGSGNGRIDDTLVWNDELYVLRMPQGSITLTVLKNIHRLVRLSIDPNQAEQGLGQPVLTLYADSPRVVLHPAAVDDPTLRLAWPSLGMARWEQP